MRDCGLPNEWSSNIWDSLYSKIKDLLVTKCSKRDHSIVKFFCICFITKRRDMWLRLPCLPNFFYTSEKNSFKSMTILLSFYTLFLLWGLFLIILRGLLKTRRRSWLLIQVNACQENWNVKKKLEMLK
jgi:hypothetical protein